MHGPNIGFASLA